MNSTFNSATGAATLLCLLALAGCATDNQLSPLPADHPANPQAAEAAVALPSRTLDVASSRVGDKNPAAPADAHTGHGGHGGHEGHGSPAAPADSPNQPAAAAAAVYTCPHHPEVVSDKPGVCPKCEMKLVRTTKKPAQNQHEGHEGGHP